MPNSKLNARIAEWQGWEHIVSEWAEPYWWAPDGSEHDCCPAYDTDLVAALKLLGWITEKPRTWTAALSVKNTEASVILSRGSKPWQLDAKVMGPPSIALPAAIARVAKQVLDLEEEIR